MIRLTRDLTIDKQRNPTLNETWEDGEEDVEEDGEDDIIDRCESPSRIWRPTALVYGILCSRKSLAGRIHRPD